jgi:serine/threonine-protein kinase
MLDRGVDRVRLDLEVVDARSGSTLVRRTLDEDARNLAGLQKEPVLTVWQMLGFEATPSALESLDEHSTNTMIACRAYLSGRGRLQMATDEQDLLAAASSLEQAIGEDPNHVPSRVALARAFGRLFETTGDQQWLERAVTQAERAGALDDDAAEPYMALGEVYSAAGNTEASLDAYRRAAARAGIAAPYIELGSAATEAGEFDTAERALQTAINLRPDFADSHNALGFLYFNTNQLDAAANQFRHATRAAPENVGARVNLGAVLALQGRTAEAIRAFEDALVIEPTARAYSNLGTLYFEDGRFGDAAEMFEKGIELEGDDIPANRYYLVANLASALHWSGEREGARSSYLRAIELAESVLEDGSGDNQTVLADLAGYYGMVGQPERGIELLEAFSLQEIHDPYMAGAIAESFEDLGERDRALQWLGMALDNGLPVDWISSRPSFNGLRNDDRYRVLVENTSTRG